MFDYAYNNNYTIDEEKKQDTNDKNSFRVLNIYVISKFYRILYLSQSRLIFLSNFEIYLLYGDVRC